MLIWDNVGLKEIKSYDYKPFGELDGGDEPTKHGFATAEYDGESSCFAMGMRMYSAEIGRFLSVDPLFEAMPRHNPYHYSFNSPLVWSDPSGLAPEKEKDQDRLMTVYLLDVGESAENYIVGVNEIDFAGDGVKAFNIAMDNEKSNNETENARERGRLGAEGNGDNGVRAKGKKAQEVLKKSVEKKYQHLIEFDSNGNVILGEGYEDAIGDDKESNFSKLADLVNNGRDLYVIEIVTHFTPLEYKWHEEAPSESKTLQDFFEQITYPTPIYGIFLGTEVKVVWNQSGTSGQILFGSADGTCRAIVSSSMGGTNMHNWLAHELYYHGWLYSRGLLHNDNTNKITETPEFKNANKR